MAYILPYFETSFLVLFDGEVDFLPLISLASLASPKTDLVLDLSNVVTFPSSLQVHFVPLVKMMDITDIKKQTPRWIEYQDLLLLKTKRKIDKKILLTRLKIILFPQHRSILCSKHKTEVKTNQLLLPILFDGVDLDTMTDMVYSDLNCNLKFLNIFDNGDRTVYSKDMENAAELKNVRKLFSVVYREPLGFWNNVAVPFGIRFLSENRGTIYEYNLDSKNIPRYRVISFPLAKFWNNRHELDYKCHKDYKSMSFDWTSTMVAQEKLDGHIVKVFWYDVDNSWYVSTNSEVDARFTYLKHTFADLLSDEKSTPELKSESKSFASVDTVDTVDTVDNIHYVHKSILSTKSEKGMNAKEIFDECAKTVGFEYSKLRKDCTYIFEMIHRDHRIIVPYPTSRLIHLATRNMNTLEEILGDDIGIPKPRVFPELNTEEKCLEYVKTLDWVHGEGLVVCETKDFYNGRSYRRVKIKSPLYDHEHLLLESCRGNHDTVVKNYILDKWQKEKISDIVEWHPEMVLLLTIFQDNVGKFCMFLEKSSAPAAAVVAAATAVGGVATRDDDHIKHWINSFIKSRNISGKTKVIIEKQIKNLIQRGRMNKSAAKDFEIMLKKWKSDDLLSIFFE